LFNWLHPLDNRSGTTARKQLKAAILARRGPRKKRPRPSLSNTLLSTWSAHGTG